MLMEELRKLLLTPENRTKLSPKPNPYWLKLEDGKHLGYFKGLGYQSWCARLRTNRKSYIQHKIGTTDDNFIANGSNVLTFEQAAKAALTWCNKHHKIAMKPMRKYEGNNIYPKLPKSPPYTVAHAIVDYMKWFRKNRKSFKTIYYAFNLHVLPELGHIPLKELKASTIRRWLDKMAESPANSNKLKDDKHDYEMLLNDPELRRRRQSSANRHLQLFRAALNRAYEYGHVDDPSQWRRIKQFQKANHPRTRYLNLEQCNEIVRSCEPKISQLIQAALLTGCRVTELTKMKVSETKGHPGRLFIANGKNDKQRYISLSKEGEQFFKKITKNRKPDEFVFLRSNGTPWTTSTYCYPFHQACLNIGINPPLNFHALRHTYASQLAMAGVPFEVIARQLGHADTRTVHRNYIHLGSNFIDTVIDEKMPKFF